MNQLTYTMAITRQQELLRQAAQYRLVTQMTKATDGERCETARRSRRRFSWTSAAAASRDIRSNVYTPAGR